MNTFCKKIIRKIINYSKITPEEYVTNLKKIGIEIGSGCRVFSPETTTIDTQNPWLLTIGNNVRITKGVSILTHDYSWSVLTKYKGEILGSCAPVTIGNNVFIGIQSTILKGSVIGNNVIVGANSVVSGELKSNSVYAGNPAKRIMSLEDFYNKRRRKQIEEAATIVKKFYNRTNTLPTEKELREYFFVFKNRNDELTKEQKLLIRKTGCSDTVENCYKNSCPYFNGIGELIDFCNIDNEKI